MQTLASAPAEFPVELALAPQELAPALAARRPRPPGDVSLRARRAPPPDAPAVWTFGRRAASRSPAARTPRSRQPRRRRSGWPSALLRSADRAPERNPAARGPASSRLITWMRGSRKPAFDAQTPAPPPPLARACLRRDARSARLACPAPFAPPVPEPHRTASHCIALDSPTPTPPAGDSSVPHDRSGEEDALAAGTPAPSLDASAEAPPPYPRAQPRARSAAAPPLRLLSRSATLIALLPRPSQVRRLRRSSFPPSLLYRSLTRRATTSLQALFLHVLNLFSLPPASSPSHLPLLPSLEIPPPTALFPPLGPCAFFFLALHFPSPHLPRSPSGFFSSPLPPPPFPSRPFSSRRPA